MTIYEKNKWTGRVLTKYFREDFSNASEDVFRCMNGDLRRKFRDYLRDHGVFIPKKKNMHIFTALAQIIEEEMDWAEIENDQVKHARPAVEVACLPVEETADS